MLFRSATITASTRSGHTVLTVKIGAKITYQKYDAAKKIYTNADAGVAKWKPLNVATTMRFRGRYYYPNTGVPVNPPVATSMNPNPVSQYTIASSTVQILELGSVDKNF